MRRGQFIIVLISVFLLIATFASAQEPEMINHGSLEQRQITSWNIPSSDEIRAYVATLKGNSINDCLAKQLGSPELHPGIAHSTAPCPVRIPERGHWLKVHFAGKARMPVPYVQAGDLPRTGAGAERSISIYLIGGPLTHADENLANLPLLQALPPNSVWVFPIYQGTGFRASLDGGADLRQAIGEVTALVEYLRREYPQARLDVIADSFGTLIAGRINHDHYDRLILLSPPLALKGKDFESYFTKHASPLTRSVDTTFVSVGYTAKKIPIKRFPYVVSAGNALGEEAMVPQSGIRSDCSLLIYGKRDQLFADEWVRDQALFDRFTQVVALDWGHDIMMDPATKSRTQQAIREFTCDPPKPAGGN